MAVEQAVRQNERLNRVPSMMTADMFIDEGLMKAHRLEGKQLR